MRYGFGDAIPSTGKPNRLSTFLKSSLFAITLFPLTLFLAAFEFSLPLKLEFMNTEIWLLGTFISLSWILTTFLDLYWGGIVDKIGIRKSLIISALCFGTFTFGFAFTDTIWPLFFLNLAAYMVFDVLLISIEGYLISSNTKHYMSFATGGFYTVWQVAYVAGPLLGAFMITEFTHNTVFLLALPLIIAACIIFAFTFRREFKERKHTHKHNFAFLKQLFKKEYWVLLGTGLCTFWFTTMSIGIPITLFIEQNSVWASAFVTVCFAIPFVFTDLFEAFLGETRKERIRVIIYGFLIGGASLYVFFHAKNLWVSGISAFFSTIGMNLASATFDVETGILAGKNEEGKMTGAFVFAKNLGWDISPFIFGTIAHFFGMRMPFVVVGAILIIFSVALFLKKKEIQ